MATNTSATREETPHVLETSRTNTIIDALKRREQAVLSDRSTDAQTRAIIRYGLEINDPCLAELVRRVDADQRISETFDFSQPPESVEETSEEHINTLTAIICRGGSDSSAAFAGPYGDVGRFDASEITCKRRKARRFYTVR